MEVQVRVECLGLEVIDRGGVLLRDVAVAHGLTNHCPVLAFRQGVIVRVARHCHLHGGRDLVNSTHSFSSSPAVYD